MTISELYELYLHNPKVTTDSRNCPFGSIFFALKGKTLMVTSMHPRLLTPDVHMR